jgi:hypothetical protein
MVAMEIAPARLVAVLALCSALFPARASWARPSSIDLRWLDRVT